VTAEIINLPCITRLDIDPQRVLTAALEAGLEGVFVMGYTKEGEVYFASSYADGGTVMWLMELAKARLLKIAGEPE
jgi:coenzyme F420-reducing hydrogenase delta subunit